MCLRFFNRIGGCSFYNPGKVFFTNAVAISIRCGIAKINGERNAIANCKFNSIKIVSQKFIDAQYDVFHLMKPLRCGGKTCYITEVMWIAWLVRHNAHVLATDTITAIIF